MTTFTKEDREAAEREPIPFAGWVQHSDDTVTLKRVNTNEPLAWMDSVGNLTKQNLGDFIPLYTHPAELTDKEIYEVWFKYGCGMPWTANTKTFIRAILRKASEK